ncbi:hypothetical protein [Haliscomenobacter sp.]|uniref:hypothetical protein n=1 Tax=Haliscomenobacter sp. TaxID=2717303 RepID=UPI00359441FF
MNKTTTRISYCLGILLILLNYSAYAQHVDGSSQSNPIIVPQSLATAYFSYRSDITAKQYWFEVNGSNASQIVPTPTSTNTEVNFNLLSISYSSRQGKIVEIQRRMWLAGNVTDRDSNYYVFPFNPVVELKVCNGKITAKDNSGNDPSLVRTYELYYNNTLVESPLTRGVIQIVAPHH